MKIKSMILTTVLLGSMMAFANIARAVSPAADDSEDIYIGTVNVSGVGVRTVVCYNDPNGSNDRYEIVGNASGLTAHTDVYGYLTSSSTLFDIFYVFRSTGSASGYCDTGGGMWTSGTWTAPMMNGNSMTLFGAAGGDLMYGGGGSSEIFLLGQDGNDQLFQYSSDGALYGGAGADDLIGYSSGNYDYLFGQSGLDCLYDNTNTASAFNCGSTSAGDYRDSFNDSISYTLCYATSSNCW